MAAFNDIQFTGSDGSLSMSPNSLRDYKHHLPVSLISAKLELPKSLSAIKPACIALILCIVIEFLKFKFQILNV
jgi:hypothetical protein